MSSIHWFATWQKRPSPTQTTTTSSRLQQCWKDSNPQTAWDFLPEKTVSVFALKLCRCRWILCLSRYAFMLFIVSLVVDVCALSLAWKYWISIQFLKKKKKNWFNHQPGDIIAFVVSFSSRLLSWNKFKLAIAPVTKVVWAILTLTYTKHKKNSVSSVSSHWGQVRHTNPL